MSRRLQADDGEPLLFMDDLERLTGCTNGSIRHYNTLAARARSDGTATPSHMPAPFAKVKRTTTRGDGKPLTVWTPVWRQDQILAWITIRRPAVERNRGQSA
jgi:hypothetical protein